MPKNKGNVTVVVDIEMRTKISFWQALKLRLAGGEAVQKFIEEEVKKGQDVQTQK